MLITPTYYNSTVNLCHQKYLKICLGIEANGNRVLFNFCYFIKALLCIEHKENRVNGRSTKQHLYTSPETPGWKKCQHKSFQSVGPSVISLYIIHRNSRIQLPLLLWNWLRIHPLTKNCISESKFPYLKHLDSDGTAIWEAWASYISYWISATNLNQSKTYAYIVLDFFVLRMKMNKLKLFDHICNNVIVTSIISISEIFSLGFSSVELPQFTAPIRGNKILG